MAINFLRENLKPLFSTKISKSQADKPIESAEDGLGLCRLSRVCKGMADKTTDANPS